MIKKYIKDCEIVLSIVCYDNEKEIETFVDQICKQTIVEKLAVCITINKSDHINELKHFLESKSVESFVFDPKKNLGYSHGCIYGLKKIDQFIKYHWSVICNTDITIQSNDFFEKFLEQINDENIWFVGPKVILAESGQNQNPFILNKPTKRWFTFKYIIFSNYFLFWIYNFISVNKKKTKKITKNKMDCLSEYIYAAHGSFMFIKRECIELIKKEEFDIFMYGEEEYIGGVVFENNQKAFYLDDICVVHNEHQTTKSINYSKIFKWFKQSYTFLKNRFY